MSVHGRIEVYGMRQAMRELYRLDKTLRNEIQADMRRAAKPVADAIKNAIPADPPAGLYGWNHRGRTAYRATNPRKVSVRTGGRRRQDGSFPLLTLRVMAAAAVIADMAMKSHTDQSRVFVARLRNHGSASRFVWPAAERALPGVEAAVRAALSRAADATSRRLVDRNGR